MTAISDWNKRSDRRLLAICSAMLFALASTIVGGCSTFNHCSNESCTDTLFSGWRDYVWAQRAFHEAYPSCQHLHSSHFRRGFVAGYSAVCNGEDAYVPAIPPKQYWGYTYQSPEGSQMVAAWFEGYPEGVRAAGRDGAGAYRDVQLSSMLSQALQPATNVGRSAESGEYAGEIPILPGQGYAPPLPETAANGVILEEGSSTEPMPDDTASRTTVGDGVGADNTPLPVDNKPFSWGPSGSR